MGKRINYIDSAKGIGILLVMVGHAISRMDQPLNTFLLSFHMPLFFFLSGMLFYYKIDDNGSFLSFFTRKLIAIGIPLVIASVLQILGDLISAIVNHSDISGIKVLDAFYHWFLISYFLMEIICWLLHKYIKYDSLKITIAVLLLVLFFVMRDIPILKQTIIAIDFSIIGYYICILYERYKNRAYYLSGGGVILLIICAICSTYNIPIGMYINQYGNHWLFIITSVIGVLGIIDIACTSQQKLDTEN